MNTPRTIKLLLSLLAIGFGAFMVVYGGYDDSPGAQLLGLLLAIGGIVGGIRTWRNRKQ
jgi:hypothetical protein